MQPLLIPEGQASTICYSSEKQVLALSDGVMGEEGVDAVLQQPFPTETSSKKKYSAQFDGGPLSGYLLFGGFPLENSYSCKLRTFIPLQVIMILSYPPLQGSRGQCRTPVTTKLLTSNPLPPFSHIFSFHTNQGNSLQNHASFHDYLREIRSAYYMGDCRKP